MGTRRVCSGCVAAVVCAAMFLAGASSASAALPGSMVSLTRGLVIGDSATEAEQLKAQEEARLASPEAVKAREESETAYEGLDAEASANLLREKFHRVLDRTDGGMPSLSAGEQVVKLISPYAAQLSLPAGADGKPGHGALESLDPVAVPDAEGHLAPIELGLQEASGGFQPKRVLVPTMLPNSVGEGISLGRTGVSLTPVDEKGGKVSASPGRVTGDTVLWSGASMGSAVDLMAKPSTTGFDLLVSLRGQAAPETLRFVVGMPEGAELVQEAGGQVQVRDAGQTLATILPPSANDAEGTAVSGVGMTVAGDVLTVTVPHPAGRYRYPIVADPEVEDPIWQNEWYYSTYYRTEWYFYHEGSAFTAPEHPENGSWTEYISGSHTSTEAGGLFYTTRGISQITVAHAEGHWNDGGSHIWNAVVLADAQGTEDYGPLPEATELERGGGGYACLPSKNCPETVVDTAPPENNNTAAYIQEAKGPGEGHGGENTVTKAYVEISQEQGPELEFNTTSSTIYNSQAKEYVPNVLYGSGGWLGPNHGAFEVRAKDRGLGLSFYRVLTTGWGDERFYYDMGECYGIQCPEYNYQGYTYRTGMPDGEDSFEALAEDYAGLYAHIYPQKIKVDYSPPHNIKIVGLQNGNELPMGGESHLKIEATDGGSGTPSSGVKSIKASVDGAEVGSTPASCSLGPCTASTEFTLAARDFTPGTHSLIVTATDNASNVVQEEFTFRVHGATPVSVGPGSVDPSSGQLTLRAGDVSLGGLSGVSRTYRSRQLTAGAEGPLGPQWSINVGGGDGLTVMPNGSVVLDSSNGGETMFVLNSKDQFEAPKGDSNLTLEDRASEHKYLLKDSKAGTETVFEQPAATQTTPPVFENSFGREPNELKGPVSLALDAAGDVWVTDLTDDRIEKFSPTGALLDQYGSYGSGAGQFWNPWGIAIDQRTGNVYITDQDNFRIEEISSTGAFIKAVGWGVKDGKDEFESCTTECRSGIAGAGNGQVSWTTGLAVDSSGNVWVVDDGNNRIEEFNEKGEYLQKFGSEGTGNGQFKSPTNIAITNGDVYVADESNDRIDEFSMAGSFIKAMGWGVSDGKEEAEACTSSCRAGIGGSGNGEFYDPRSVAIDPISGDLYVTELGDNRVQEITTTGRFVTKFGSVGSGLEQFALPMGVVVSQAGALYVTDFENARVQEWTRPKWWPTDAKGALSVTATYTYAPVEGRSGTTAMQPYEVLAPAPTGVSCGTKPEELQAGCRALTFNYAASTTATGEGQNEWGDYKGHLTRVYFNIWEAPSKIKTVEVAHYLYDKQGRLRAEWDPRIEPEREKCVKEPLVKGCLTTVYGYDAEGHVTAVTHAGQESWAVTYGTMVGDPNTGRLLKVARAQPPAGATEEEVKKVLKEQTEEAKDTEVPKLSGSTVVGVTMGVSSGVWSNEPVAYAYQWEDCNSSGGQCTPILGATNANYKPSSGDVGHTLVAQVSATNGGGSVMAATVASAVVTSTASSSYTQSIDSGYSLNAVSCVPGTTDCVVGDSKGNAYYATNVSASGAASWKAWSGPGTSPSEALACPASSLCLMAAGSDSGYGGNMYYATSLGGAWTLAYGPAYGVDAISCTSSSFCVDGQDGYGYFRYSTSPPSTSWNLEEQGTASMKGVFCLSSSFCAIADGTGSVHVATTTAQIESSSWTATDVDGSSALNGIACTSTTSCVTVDGVGDVVNLTISSNGAATAAKHDIDGTNSLTAITCTGSSTCVAVDTAGNVFLSKNGGETWTKQYSLNDKLTSVSCASSTLCATVDTTGHITAFNPAGGTATEGTHYSPGPGSTIEYRVPVSGTGLPTLTEAEVAKWGQKDDPVEGTAIFPPDEPQGWPASGYKRASIRYWDVGGRTVNSATPTDAIYTREYNEANEVTRTLSADDRAAALKEGCVSVSKKECKSAEVSEKLDTRTEYNPEETEIVKVTGPEHKVKLSSGTEVQARAVTHDYYDEGAAEAELRNHETYDLLTKSTSGALLSNGEEKDVRTTVTSYSGQNDLGWILRKPTSATADPQGLKLVTTTIYDPTTGNVVETRSPGAGVAQEPRSSGYVSAWGGPNAASILSKPYGVAIDGEGHVWVADAGYDRVIELTSTGGFMAKFGSEGNGNGQFKEPEGIAVDSKGDVWVADAGNNRVQELSSTGQYMTQFGSTGTGNGQFKSPRGIAVDGEGHMWVADTGNNRVQELSATGEFIRAVGSEGSGNGQFKSPYAIAVGGADVWVADTSNERVEEFSSSGGYLAQFKVTAPIAILIDASAHVWVSSLFAEQVSEFTSNGVKLGQVGSHGKENGQFEIAVGLAVNKEGDVWLADYGNARVEEFVPVSSTFEYLSQFGSEGTGTGQFKKPGGVAIDGEGHVWVADTANNRIQEFSATGAFIRQFGSKGTGNGQFESPYGLTIDGKGNLWVADMGNSRVQEFSSTGTYMSQIKTSYPLGVVVDSGEHVWVTNLFAKVTELGMTGETIRTFGSEGTENGKLKTPWGIAIDKEGHVWVADEGNNRVQKFSSTGEYLAQYSVTKPHGLTIDGSGNLWVAYAASVEEMSSAGTVLRTFGSEGTGNGQFKEPQGIAVGAEGIVWVADTANNRVQGLGYVESYSYTRQYPPPPPPMQFYSPKSVATDSSGNVWVADTENHRIQEVSSSGTFIRQISGSLKKPEGVAIDGSGNVWVTDASTDKVSEFSATGTLIQSFGEAGTGNRQFKEPAGIAVEGEDVYVVDRGNDRVQELTTSGVFVHAFGAAGSGEGQLSGPRGMAIDSEGDVWVADTGNNRIEVFSSEGVYLVAFGTAGSGNGQFSKPEGLAFGAKGNVWVADTGNSRIEEVSPTGAYIQQIGSAGAGNEQMSKPADVAIDGSGHIYVLDTDNDRVQEWVSPSSQHEGIGTGGVHGRQMIYYTTVANSTYPECGGRPEWANLPCRTQPAAQPETKGLPSLPITVTTYNMWDEVETTTETFVTCVEVAAGTGKYQDSKCTTAGTGNYEAKSYTRTKTQTYDPAGRALTSEETSTNDKALPKVTNEYNAETGALEKQSATIKGVTKTVTAKDNTLGQLIEYTDAEGNVAKYTYEEGGDGRLEEISEGRGEEAKSDQTYSYDPTTGFMTKLIDSAAGTFTAAYDIEGKMTSEVYPNGMCANTGYDATGHATSLSYIKTRNCSESNPAVWFSDNIASSIHGETLAQTSTLSAESYAYDNAGRLTEVGEEPAGKGCTLRLYAYDEESNRTSLTTREPAAEGKCAAEGGTIQQHVYDPASRLMDEGVEYEAFGNTTKLPAADAGEHEIQSAYYVDNQVATQTQNGETLKYAYDPLGRTMETVSEGKTSSTVISHYAGPGAAVTWTSEGAEKWTRSIPGIDGSLSAVETSSTAPVLQLHDLQGNIVGTASLSESETKLLSTYDSTEFGVPQPGTTPPKYAWLGAGGVASEPAFESGVSTQSGATYVPLIGRALQTEPIASPGSFPDGTGGAGIVKAPYLGVMTEQLRTIGIQEEAAHEEAKKREAAERAAWEECPASECHVNGAGEGNCEVNCVVEEEGDPCETVKAYGSAEFLGATVMKAWAKIKWCWTKNRVVSAYGAGKGELAIDQWDVPLHFKFLRWEEAAYWEGTKYIIERTAHFWGELAFCGVSAPMCPGKGYSLNLTFALEPGGKYSTGSSLENPTL